MEVMSLLDQPGGLTRLEFKDKTHALVPSPQGLGRLWMKGSDSAGQPIPLWADEEGM